MPIAVTAVMRLCGSRAKRLALSVLSAMTRNPVCVDETATVDEVVARMDDHQISQILVLHNERPAGIVGRVQLLVALERCLSRQG